MEKRWKMRSEVAMRGKASYICEMRIGARQAIHIDQRYRQHSHNETHPAVLDPSSSRYPSKKIPPSTSKPVHPPILPFFLDPSLRYCPLPHDEVPTPKPRLGPFDRFSATPLPHLADMQGRLAGSGNGALRRNLGGPRTEPETPGPDSD